MEVKRKPFQGVLNIIRFNWHFYLIAGIILTTIILFKPLWPYQFEIISHWLILLAILTMVISLLISYYVYDHSDLYQLKWLPKAHMPRILNINAGFDEMSLIIKNKLPDCDLTNGDFYNPQKHTEISIKRARKAYPPNENTIQVATDRLPFSDDSFDYTLAFLSAHEIRDQQERIEFFKELNRVTKSAGQLFVTEHLRDLNNFLAYNIGFFHFHSRSTWLNTFAQANLVVVRVEKTTPFISTFILEKNGDTF